MRLLDRYIIGRFLVNFVILFVLLFVFAVAIDLILQLDEFVETARSMLSGDGREPGALAVMARVAGLVANFHGPRLFQFYAYLLGLLSIGAMGFTLAQMHRNRELVAMLASGVSMYRIAAPFVAAAFGLNVVQLLNQEVILPRVAPLLIRSHGSIGTKGVGPFPVRFLSDSARNLLHAPSFDPATRTLAWPTIIQRDGHWRTTRRITAAAAVWDPARKGWMLEDGLVLSIDPETAARGDALSSATVQERIEFFPTDLSPDAMMMQRYTEYASMLSLRQIRRIPRGDDALAATLQRYEYSRFAAVCVNLLALGLTLPLFLLREPASLLRQSLLCAAVAVPVMLVALVGMSVELPGVSPAVGVFLPTIILAPITLGRGLYVRT